METQNTSGINMSYAYKLWYKDFVKNLKMDMELFKDAKKSE
jgi:hypothetical protein